MDERVKFLLTILTVLAIMFGFIFLSINESEKMPCSEFRNYNQQDLPARCINYFRNNE